MNVVRWLLGTSTAFDERAGRVAGWVLARNSRMDQLAQIFDGLLMDMIGKRNMGDGIRSIVARLAADGAGVEPAQARGPSPG